MADYALPVYDEGEGVGYSVDPANELLRRQQEESLAQHKAYASTLEEKQSHIHLRGEDLDLTKRLLQATDPMTPKPVRDFLLKGISGSVGVDPRGDYSKELQKMISALDPQSLEMLRKTFGADIPNSPPGQIKERVRGIFSGQVPVSDLLMKVNQTARSMVGSMGDPSLVGGPEGDELVGGQRTQVPGTVVDQGEPGIGDRLSQRPQVTDPATGQPTGQTPRRSIEPTQEELQRGRAIRRYPTQGDTLPADRQVLPGLLDALGVDTSEDLRHSDVITRYPRVPQDPEGQKKLMEDIGEQNASAAGGVMSAVRLHQLFRGKPETLGVVGGVIRTLDEVADQLNGAGRALGAKEGFDLFKLRPMVEGVAKHISDLYAKSGLPQTAETSARIQSAVLEMAYDMAIARGIPGNRLTNNIIAQHLQTLGQSASVQQFEGVLKDVVARSLDQGARVMGERVGDRTYYHKLGSLSDQDLKELFTYYKDTGGKGGRNVIPDRFLDALDREMETRETGSDNRKTKIQASSPTLAEEQATLAESIVRREVREEQQLRLREQEGELSQARETRAARKDVRDEDRAARQEFESNRRFELQERKEARQAEHQRRQEIMQAFQRMGAAIAGYGRSGGAPSLSAPNFGGDQDSSAFRATPPPTRHAPTPVNAAPYQRSVGKK